MHQLKKAILFVLLASTQMNPALAQTTADSEATSTADQDEVPKVEQQEQQYPRELGTITWSPITSSNGSGTNLTGSFKAIALNTFDSQIEVTTVITLPAEQKLQEGHIYASYLQLETSANWYESFVCAVRYTAAEVDDTFNYATCGDKRFSDIQEQGNFKTYQVQSDACPSEAGKIFEVIPSATKATSSNLEEDTSSQVTCTFTRPFSIEGLPEIIAGELLPYQVGFNIYADETSEREDWAYSKSSDSSSSSSSSEALIPARQSPIGKFTYPYVLSTGELPYVDDAAHEISGTYSLTLKTPQRQELEVAITLKAKDDRQLEAGKIYQSYLQVRSEEPQTSFESFICTVRSQAGSPIAEGSNFSGESACDPLDFNTVTEGNFNRLKFATQRCPADPAYRLDLAKSSASESAITCVFTRLMQEEGLQEIQLDKDITYRVGFKVYDSPISIAVSKGASLDSIMRFDSPESWIEYPMELVRQPFRMSDESKNEEGFSLDGFYTVTVETLLRSVMRWELVLTVPGDFSDMAFYQVFVQLSTRGEDEVEEEEPYYESFHFTLLYQDANGGDIVENNAWIFSFCDPVIFSNIVDGNYQHILRVAEQCSAEPAYVFDWETSRTEPIPDSPDSRLVVNFSRRLKQRGLQDIFVNSPISYRIGFNVYDQAKEDKAVEGFSQTDIQIVIPYEEPSNEEEEEEEVDPVVPQNIKKPKTRQVRKTRMVKETC